MIQLAEPFKTPYDLRFSVLGFPVRVQALFWLAAAVLGLSAAGYGENITGRKTDTSLLLLTIVAIFISILVHELGHALMMRRLGLDSHVVLYWLGGLAIQGDDEQSAWGSMQWKPERTRAITSADRIWIALAGPLAGFALALVIVLLVFGSGGKVTFQPDFPQFWDVSLDRSQVVPPVTKSNLHLYLLVEMFLSVNILWGLMNLLPIFPLDGGQIAREFFLQGDPWTGAKRSLLLSTVCAGLVAVGGLALKDNLMFFMFASLAVQSYMTMQQMNNTQRPW